MTPYAAARKDDTAKYPCITVARKFRRGRVVDSRPPEFDRKHDNELHQRPVPQQHLRWQQRISLATISIRYASHIYILWLQRTRTLLESGNTKMFQYRARFICSAEIAAVILSRQTARFTGLHVITTNQFK
jgi:hypothetical protein